MTETSYGWMEKALKLVPALHETDCEVCKEPTLYMAWCQQHGMKECATYKKDKKPPKTCGRLSCMLESGEMTP